MTHAKRSFVRTLLSTTVALCGVTAATGLAQAGNYGASHHAGDNIYRVDLNKTQILRLPTDAGSIVIGNPNIADVSVQSPNTLFVVGRGFGETNLIVLDRMGNTMVNADIQVTALTPSHGVRVFKGADRSTYSCAPYCQPSPTLGDDVKFMGAFSGEAKEPSQASIASNAPATAPQAGLQGSPVAAQSGGIAYGSGYGSPVGYDQEPNGFQPERQTSSNPF